MKRITLLPLVFACLCSHSLSSHSAEWKIEPSIQFGTGYNDNVRLQFDDEISSIEINLQPGARFSVETPRSGLSGDLGFELRRYLDEKNLNDENARLDITSYHRMSRSSVGLNLGLVRDTTQDSQLEETGIVFDRVNQFLLRANPTWTYNLEERTSLTTGYTYTDIYYDKGGSRFVESTSHNTQISLNRILSEQTTSAVTLSHRITSNDNDVQTTFTSLQGGASHQFSETLSASFFAGARRTTSKFDRQVPVFSGGFFIGFSPITSTIKNTNWGSILSGSLNKQFERGSSAITFSRDVSNTVSGALFEITNISWENSYRFSETLSANLILSLYRSRNDSDIEGSDDTKFYDVTPRFNWDFAQFWRISALYRYRNQSIDGRKDNAIQNYVNLTLTYQWPRISVSR